jgi:hypothetical protein
MGTLGATTGPLVPAVPDLLPPLGSSSVSLHDAGVLGTHLESMAAQAVAPIGVPAVPADGPIGEVLVEQLEPGPESGHGFDPVGTVTLESVAASADCRMQPTPGAQIELVE